MGKKALMVIAPSNFRDEEYFETKAELEASGFTVMTASKVLGTAKGMLGRTAEPDMALSDAKAEDYDAVIFVGGSGSKVYFDDSSATGLARKAFEKGKVVAAICIAPTILANAGILKGKKATIFRDQGLIDNLARKGSKYTAEQVTADGRIITAEGPHASKAFGKKIAEALK